jgi:hypothetical protein
VLVRGEGRGAPVLEARSAHEGGRGRRGLAEGGRRKEKKKRRKEKKKKEKGKKRKREIGRGKEIEK